MASKQLVASLRRAREIEVDLGGGLFVTALRPTESQVAKMTKALPGETDKYTINVEDDDVRDAVIAWKGFSEAAILGEAVGSSDPIEFDRELWAELAADSRSWYYKVAMALLDAIMAHNQKRAEQLKNSTPA